MNKKLTEAIETFEKDLFYNNPTALEKDYPIGIIMDLAYCWGETFDEKIMYENLFKKHWFTLLTNFNNLLADLAVMHVTEIEEMLKTETIEWRKYYMRQQIREDHEDYNAMEGNK